MASRRPLDLRCDDADETDTEETACAPAVFHGPTLSRAMDDYLDELRRRRRTSRTIKTYRKILYTFADRFHIDTRVSEIEGADLLTYVRSAAGTNNTKAHREGIIRCWLKWCLATGRLERDPMVGVPRMRRVKVEDPALVEAEQEARMLRMENVRSLSWVDHGAAP